jgi:hypothetical protein
MALSKGMTALRAALGAVGGGLEGYAQMQELQRKRMREEEATRQAQQAGIANLMLQGFDRPESVMQRQQGARQAAGSAIVSALQAASGQTPTPITGDLKALGEGYATARPDRTVTIGGQTLTLRETPLERQERLANTQKMRTEQDFENAVAQLPAELQPIARASKVIPANVLQTREPRQPRVQLNEKTGQVINLDTREVFNIPGYKQPPKEAKAESDKPRFGEVSSLRKEFNTESRPYKTINDALKNIEALGTKPNPTPQDLQALVYQFVKVQDPTSVVRESEYANAANAAALTDKIGNYAKRVLEGQTLTAKQRADMVQTARALRVEAMNQYGQLANSYEELAGSFGMDPKTIVPNRLDRGAQAQQKPSVQTLEQEFPGQEAKIKEARSLGHSDAAIRSFLSRGR